MNNFDYKVEDKSKYFIGRKNYLDQINTAKQENIALVPIKGTGGIGKTTLLNRYHQLISNESTTPTIFHFDFDDYQYKTAFDIRLAIVDKLGKKHFKHYLFKRSALDSQRTDTHHDILKQLHQEIAESWKEAFEKQAQARKKIILLFDTLDALTNDELNDVINSFFSSPLSYTFIVVTGRGEAIEPFTKKLKKLWTKIETKKLHSCISLAPLTKQDALDYFSRKSKDYGTRLPWKIGSETEKAIYTLTEGTPILVDLFMTILLEQRDNSFLEWIERKNHDVKLKKIQHNEFKSLFKQQLISRFSRNYKVHELVPLLAHVWPVNQEMLANLMNIEIDKAAQLMEDAKEANFIKNLPDPMQAHNLSSIEKNTDFMLTLHDIMRDMMLEYGWEDLDSEKETRKNYSKRFLQITQNISNEINEHIKQYHSKKQNNDKICTNDTHSLYLLKNNINEKKLKHQLFLNPKKGISLFIELFDKTYGKTRHDESHHIQQLFEEVGNTIETDSFNQINYVRKINIKENEKLFAKYLLKEIQFWGIRNIKRAENAYNTINQLNLPDEFLLEIRDELAEYKIRNGLFPEALASLNEGIKYCEKNTTNNNEKIYQQWFKLLNVSGWLYRLIGDIEKSNESYAQAHELPAKHALRLSIDIKPLDMAYLLLNMSYIKALLRQYSIATSLSKQAKDLFKSANYPRGTWMVESARGRIEIEFDHFTSARRYFETALDRFPHDDREWRSKIFLGIAHSFWLEKICSDIDKESKKNLLNKAKYALKNAAKQAMPTDQAELLHLKANIAFTEKDFTKSSQYYRECVKVSNKMHALYYQARAIAGLLKIAARQGNIEQLPQLQTEFKTFLKNNAIEEKDSLSLAIFKRFEGDLYLLSDKPEQAIERYKEALPIISRYGRYTPSNLKGQMKSLTYFFTKFIEGGYSSNKSEQERRQLIRNIGRELLRFWLTCPCDENGNSKNVETYSRLYPDAYQIISQWIDGNPNQWDHSDEF